MTFDARAFFFLYNQKTFAPPIPPNPQMMADYMKPLRQDRVRRIPPEGRRWIMQRFMRQL